MYLIEGYIISVLYFAALSMFPSQRVFLSETLMSSYITNSINSILIKDRRRFLLLKIDKLTSIKDTVLIRELKPTPNDNVSAKSFIFTSLHL